MSDPSATQQISTQLHLVVSQTDTGITQIETAAQAISNAYDVLDAVSHGSQDAELLKTAHQFDAARQQINGLLAVFDAARDAVQMYLDALQAGQPAVPVTPAVTATVPAQPRQRSPVQHRDGSYYPVAAGWAVDLLPRRVREGEERERTVGQVMLAGSFAGQM
ncbi:MAG: hypothetical protein ACRDTF_23190, partial [Pseudonocardiaceae bacterium]